jgi:hypothetical protein
MNAVKITYTLVLCCFLFYSCKGKEKDLPDQDFIDFAQKIEQQIHHGNENPIANAFDYEEFERRVFVGLDIPKKEKQRAAEFIRNNINPAKTTLEAVMNGAHFHFVKFYRKNNEPHLIFRTYFEGGVSLEDWLLGVKDGRIVVYDAFLIVSGINWSDNCRHKLCNYLELYTDEVININELINVNYHIAEDNYATADSLLFWIMPQMQENMYARTIEMNLSSLSKSYENMQALANEFAKTFPDEQRISTFYLVQSSIQHGLPNETIKHIYTLIDWVGDDPIYYLFQSWSFRHANANDDALSVLDSAIRYMPYIFDLYVDKLDIYYSDYNYQACVKLLYQIDTCFVSKEEDVSFFKTKYPLLTEYKAFSQWLETRNK